MHAHRTVKYANSDPYNKERQTMILGSSEDSHSGQRIKTELGIAREIICLEKQYMQVQGGI